MEWLQWWEWCEDLSGASAKPPQRYRDPLLYCPVLHCTACSSRCLHSLQFFLLLDAALDAVCESSSRRLDKRQEAKKPDQKNSACTRPNAASQPTPPPAFDFSAILVEQSSIIGLGETSGDRRSSLCPPRCSVVRQFRERQVLHVPCLAVLGTSRCHLPYSTIDIGIIPLLACWIPRRVIPMNESLDNVPPSLPLAPSPPQPRA